MASATFIRSEKGAFVRSSRWARESEARITAPGRYDLIQTRLDFKQRFAINPDPNICNGATESELKVGAASYWFQLRLNAPAGDALTIAEALNLVWTGVDSGAVFAVADHANVQRCAVEPSGDAQYFWDSLWRTTGFENVNGTDFGDLDFAIFNRSQSPLGLYVYGFWNEGAPGFIDNEDCIVTGLPEPP